jgi:lipopolysaccharide biosynthesis glycosyltransferase
MTLRKLATFINPKIISPKKGNDVAILFLLNESFIPGFKTLIYSMISNNTLLDCDIIILSEDKKIFNDPQISEISDRCIHINDDIIAEFSRVPNDKVHESLKLNWIAKYTYLKWLIFEDYGYKKHIFIDSDILCMRNIDELIDSFDGDICAGPVFTEDLYKTSSGDLPLDERERKISEFIELDPDKIVLRNGPRLNSGVLILNSKVLNSDFRRSLIDIAVSENSPVEQRLIRKRIEIGDINFQMISPYYNFHYNYLNRISARSQIYTMNKIKLLHFIGSSANPWMSKKESLPSILWKAYASEAEKACDIFRWR